MRLYSRFAVLALAGTVMLQPSYAQQKTAPSAELPSATLELESEQMRLIYGGTAGKGTLHFEGKDYVFTFKSASAGLGAKAVTSVKAVGKVYGLKRVEDFEGRYNAVSKGVIAGNAKAKATYSNGLGVRVELSGTVKGAGLSMGAGTATIKLVKE